MRREGREGKVKGEGRMREKRKMSVKMQNAWNLFSGALEITHVVRSLAQSAIYHTLPS